MCDHPECAASDCRYTIRVVDEADFNAASAGIFFWMIYLICWVPAKFAYDLVRGLFRD